MRSILVLFMVAAYANAYSGGAPPEVCDDMIPKHPVEPQKSRLPYNVDVDRKLVRGGDTVDITISGGDKKDFLGYLLEVRGANEKAVGSFIVPADDRYSRAFTCHNTKNSAVTHKNSAKKNDLTLKWEAPREKGTYTVYATVAENGGVFWVHKPTATITVR